jgi:hypothetical protein
MNPVLPFDRPHIAAANHIECSGITICHHAKSLCRRFGVDCLPISIQHKNRRFVQDVVHTGFCPGEKSINQCTRKHASSSRMSIEEPL